MDCHGFVTPAYFLLSVRHYLDLVLVHEINDDEGSKDATDSVPVSFSRGPGEIDVLNCTGDQMAVGFRNGARTPGVRR